MSNKNADIYTRFYSADEIAEVRKYIKPTNRAIKVAVPHFCEMGLFIAVLVLSYVTSVTTEPHLSDQELVDYLNKEQHLFKAELPSMSEEEFKSRLMDMKYLEEQEMVYAKEIEMSDDEIPERFDAREKWPECQSITTIRDQANCGSCWAVAAASAMSDRVCIHSKGKVKAIVSDTDILACCGTLCAGGCNGGYAVMAWQYAKKSGICSGGPYRQKGVCKPYAFHPCGRHANQTYYGECTVITEKTPACRTTCQVDYPIKYENDKIFAKTAYRVSANEKAIQKEIMTNGPVQATFTVHSDFRAYKKGIYRPTYGWPQGGHAVKIVGWGVENGTKYWTISNSWNSDWGENGFFRMIRGVDSCNLERWVNAGMMKV